MEVSANVSERLLESVFKRWLFLGSELRARQAWKGRDRRDTDGAPGAVLLGESLFV